MKSVVYFVILIAAVWVCSSGVLGAVDLKTTALFESSLDNTQEVPPSEISAHSGTAKLQFDLNTKSLAWSIEHTVFDSTGASINGPAEPGANGAAIITFSSTATPIQGSQTLGSDEEKSLLAGLLYINIQSPSYPQGDIRGQIVRSKSKYVSNLSGQSFNPPVKGNTTGEAQFTYDHTTQQLSFTITHNITNPGTAALHGPASEDQVANATFRFPNSRSPINGNFQFNVSDEVVLFDNLFYINITSNSLPTGELRGQVVYAENNEELSHGMAWWKVILLVVGIVAVVAVIGAGSYFGLRYYKKQKNYKKDGQQYADPLLK